MKITNYIPYKIKKDVYEIDYEKLYKEGRRYLIFDLDNTLIPYDQHSPTNDIINLFKKIKDFGFKVAIASNNKKSRVYPFCEDLDIKGAAWSLKPFTSGYRRIYKYFNYPKVKEIITIGDQIMTDVVASNKMDFDCILVNPLKEKTEKWYTKLNRRKEKKIIKKIKKETGNEELYEKLLKR